MEIGNRLSGRQGTVYEGVQARIDAITKRYVQVYFDRVVTVNGMKLLGQVLSKSAVKKYFDNYEQLSLFDHDQCS
ncbi:hypothetical protein DNHGIG_40410 [Collibacillus ludicampi]|uniref:Uncharacterized protein n=1 Tax=Collibacillus ludicampi TaxID=2771369 RepID=A0AAV4LND6_9BACL|nr:hypothetical protein [Collibacillus ludicampi]GIM48492.1 hypothetical protein DNHGIG_40410 [Collibacillus ludicampi]